MKKVKDVMRRREVVTVRPDNTVALAVQIMLWSGVRHLPVVRDREIVGIVSEHDILRRSTEVGARTARADLIERVMTTPAITIDADQPVFAAAWLMSARKLGCLPVLVENELAGIITATDMVRLQFEAAAAEILAAPGSSAG